MQLSAFAYCTLIVVSVAAVAQQPIQISGRVIDDGTGEPLPYATVSVLGKALGTITNADGSFGFSAEGSKPGDSLVVSMIGYARIKVPLDKSATDRTFRLIQQPVLLDEVVVVSVDEIFKKIRTRVKDNYPVESYQMECFYREIKKQKETYQSLLEAALVIEDNGYDHQKNPESVFVREIRGSSKFVNEFSDFWQKDNLLRETLGLNAVRHPASHPSVFGKVPYRLKSMGRVFDRPVYILASDTAGGEYWPRTIYVDTETYAIYRSEETIIRYSPFWNMDNNDSIQMRLTKGTSTFDFRPVNGKLYLNHIRHEIESEYVNKQTRNALDRFTIINELLVTDIHTTSKVDSRKLPQMKNYALEQQVTPYNESFWATYNVIRQTALEAQVMNDLIKNSSLKDQFIRSSSGNQPPKRRGRE